MRLAQLNEGAAYHGGHGGLSHGPATFDNDAACPPHFRGLKPYAHDCHRYINCGTGQPVIQTCGPGTVFSAVSQTCDFESSVPCVQSGRAGRLQELPAEPRCAPGASGLQPHPTDCTKFLHCDNGRTFIKDCGPGTAYSPSLQVCDFKYKVDCGYVDAHAGGVAVTQGELESVSLMNTLTNTQPAACPAGTRGLHPHPHDPHKYLKCGIGVQAIVENCPLGEIFDAHSLICIPSGISDERAHVSSKFSYLFLTTLCLAFSILSALLIWVLSIPCFSCAFSLPYFFACLSA